MIAGMCRLCGAELRQLFCDLGMSPLSNAFLGPSQLQQMEPFYPLCPFVCNVCYLVQLPELQSPQLIFSDYPYFSSYSETWLKHVEAYTRSMIERFGFDHNSHVVEIASNDGHLLQYFRKKRIPVLGIEPAANVAKVAHAAGIPTVVGFFGIEMAKQLAAERKQADLLLGNNVLAHVPDINDFVAGMKILLKVEGIITMEFPHLLRLMQETQFDTIYHEHFSYFSLLTAERVFTIHGLSLFDVEEIPTHGGSLRIYATHAEDTSKMATGKVEQLKREEIKMGLNKPEAYSNFGQQVQMIKRNLVQFLIQMKSGGESIAAYGAPAKGNTLLNYCGIGTDFIDYTVDLSPHKQGRFLPGTHIPIFHPEKIKETKPDYLLILPWNLKDEIMEQMAHIRQWGGKFILPIPQVKIL